MTKKVNYQIVIVAAGMEWDYTEVAKMFNVQVAEGLTKDNVYSERDKVERVLAACGMSFSTEIKCNA